ncbi:L-rhamnose mutarotase [Streptacidiphilus monticola]
MKRIAQTTRLVPERREEYLALHRAVWPAVEAALHAAQIRNYSIFLHGDTLFAYYEYHGDDFEADLATVKADPETQRWWTFTDPCQDPGRTPRRQPLDGPAGDLAPRRAAVLT